MIEDELYCKNSRNNLCLDVAKILWLTRSFQLQVLLFPEGTDLTERTKAKSEAFAKKNDLNCYNYVLHPRTTGFTYLVEKLRLSEYILI